MEKITRENIVSVVETGKQNTYMVYLTDGSRWEYNYKSDKWTRDPQPSKDELVASFNNRNGRK